MKSLGLILLTLMCTGAFGVEAKEAFRVGEPAPAFKAGRWLNGGPIERLEPGQIYVVEFWATWCGPCKAAMPQLSEIARKHAGRVTVIGVNILERGNDPAKIDKQVDRFMAKGGKAMEYPVCADTQDLYLTKQWYERSGSPGIPATVVVDGKGKIAWLGGPEKELERTLEKLLAGTFDYDVSAADAVKQAAKSKEFLDTFMPVSKALEAKQWAKALALADEAAKRNEKYSTEMRFFRYQALLHVDEEQAYLQAEKAVKSAAHAKEMASIIAAQDDLSKRTYELAARAMEGQSDAASLQTLASLRFKLGEPAKAVELQKRLIEAAKEYNLTPAQMDDLEATLEKYQAAAAAGGK